MCKIMEDYKFMLPTYLGVFLVLALQDRSASQTLWWWWGLLKPSTILGCDFVKCF